LNSIQSLSISELSCPYNTELLDHIQDHFPSLKSFSINSNSETLPHPLEISNTSLTDLNLSNCNINSLNCDIPQLVKLNIENCNNLVQLHLQCPALTQLLNNNCEALENVTLFCEKLLNFTWPLILVGSIPQNSRARKIDIIKVKLDEAKNRHIKISSPYLQDLDLSPYGQALMNYDINCPKLISLNMNGCSAAPKSLLSILEYLPNLQSLSLRSCQRLTESHVDKIIEVCKHLKKLNLTSCCKITDVVKKIARDRNVKIEFIGVT